MTDNFKSFHFPFAEVRPSTDELLGFLQSENVEEDHPVRIAANDILLKLENHNDISGGYVIKDTDYIDIKAGIISIENQKLNVGKQICGYMKGADQIALFVCTAGSIFTEITSQYNSKGEYLEAFITDAIGSLTVEKAMDNIQEKLEKSEREARVNISNRYSPGYCNWALSGQKLLFELIGNNPIKVSLTDSCLMTPIKSVSGIIGIGKEVKKREYGCLVCNNTECIYRKIINKK